MPPMAVVCPCQNCSQVAGSAVAGSQGLTYGLRTASGAAGGRIGVAARVPLAAAYPPAGGAAAWLAGPRGVGGPAPAGGGAPAGPAPGGGAPGVAQEGAAPGPGPGGGLAGFGLVVDVVVLIGHEASSSSPVRAARGPAAATFH